jgi:trehalose-6-phosphate synthase
LLDALLCYDGVTKNENEKKGNFLSHSANMGEREKRKKNEQKKNYFDPHMVVVETTTIIINVLSLKRDLHKYEGLPRFISNGKDLQKNV